MKYLNHPIHLLFSILIVCNSSVRSAIDLTGIGTRAQSMGGNFRSIADDYSALFWNPAGMAFQKGSQAGFSLTLVDQSSSFLAAPSPLYQNGPAGLSLKQFSATFPYTTHSTVPLVAVPSAGWITTTGRWAYGVGAWAAFGVRAKYDLIGTSDYNRNPGLFPEEDWEDDMKFIDIHPAVAYRFSDQLSAGAGLSLMIADIYLRKPAFSPMNPYIMDASIYAMFDNYLSQLPEPARNSLSDAIGSLRASPKDHILADTYLQGTGVSFGGNLGIMFKPVPSLSIGASIQYYADIPVKGDATVYVYYPYEEEIDRFMTDSVTIQGQTYEGLNAFYKNAYQNNEISLTDYYLLTKMGTGVIDTSRSDAPIHADMSLPVRAGIGISYTGIRNLTIAADLAVTTWSAWDTFEIFDRDNRIFSRIDKSWKDVIRAGIGLEYALPQFKIRGGYYTESRAAINATMVPTNPDVNRRHVFSAGAEIPWGRFRLHCCYEQTFMKDLDIEVWVPFDNDFDYKNMAGHYTSSMRNFMIGMDIDI